MASTLIAPEAGAPPSEPESKSLRIKCGGWSDSIHDYVILESIKGTATSHLVPKLSRVVRARLTEPARMQALSAGGTLSQGEFCLSIIHDNEADSYVDAIDLVERELDIFKHLKERDNMVNIVHSFTASDIKLDAISLQVKGVVTFLVLPFYKYSLDDVISYRKKVNAVPLMRPEEILMIVRDISRALQILGSHLVVHRHLVPSNIVFGGSTLGELSLDDINKPGVSALLCNFNLALDFTTSGHMAAAISPFGMVRSGQPGILPPEISTVSICGPQWLNYTATDVFALGIIVGTMLSSAEFLNKHGTITKRTLTPSGSGFIMELLPEAVDIISMSSEKPLLANKCIELFLGMMARDYKERWTADKVQSFCYHATHFNHP